MRTAEVIRKTAETDIAVRLNTDGSGKKKLISFFGGQGSINVNSWSSDSRHVAFVSYELLH